MQVWQFAGKAGERVNLSVASDGGLLPFLTLFSPGNYQIATGGLVAGMSSAEINGLMLPTSGTYSIMVGAAPWASNGQQVGSYTLRTARLQPPLFRQERWWRDDQPVPR
jgi:hypothetical protein